MIILYYYYADGIYYPQIKASKIDDINLVLGFLNQLEKDFKRLLDKKAIKKISRMDKRYKGLFEGALKEAFHGYENFLRSFDNLLKSEDELLNLHYKLKSIGFTGKSLKLKLSILDDFWSRLKRDFDDIIDWTNEASNALLEALLKHTNNLLGSLVKIFPILEPIKEFKEVMESGIRLVVLA